jgi:putative transposase
VAYRLVEAEKASPLRHLNQVLPVARMLGLLGVSRSGFYGWRARGEDPPGPRARRREELAAAVVAAHRDSDGVYGAPRITAELRGQGHRVSRKTVAKVMAGLRIQGISPRPWRVTTQPDPEAAAHPDLVGRVFDTDALDRVWISDITYLATDQGWLYLAAVRDACSRRVIGWAIEDHMRAELVTAALDMAVRTRGQRPEKVVFHADRGSQYTSRQVAQFAAEHDLACSAGVTGVCWDNAMAESFWATLKVEFYYRHNWPSKHHARSEVTRWITQTYNARRRHSALGMLTPLQFELHKRGLTQAA